jgi:hypothetical protein
MKTTSIAVTAFLLYCAPLQAARIVRVAPVKVQSNATLGAVGMALPALPTLSLSNLKVSAPQLSSRLNAIPATSLGAVNAAQAVTSVEGAAQAATPVNAQVAQKAKGLSAVMGHLGPVAKAPSEGAYGAGRQIEALLTGAVAPSARSVLGMPSHNAPSLTSALRHADKESVEPTQPSAPKRSGHRPSAFEANGMIGVAGFLLTLMNPLTALVIAGTMALLIGGFEFTNPRLFTAGRMREQGNKFLAMGLGATLAGLGLSVLAPELHSGILVLAAAGAPLIYGTTLHAIGRHLRGR